MLRFIAVSFGLLAAAPGMPAGTTEPLPNPVLAPGAPWYFDSFVVDTPREAGWASFSKDANSAELGKKYADGHTAAAVVEAHKLAEAVASEETLLGVVKRTIADSGGPGTRMTGYRAEVVAPKGLLCARSTAHFEDRREQFGQDGVLLVRALTCVRPDRPEIVVGLQFAERTPAGDSAPPDDVAEQFLHSLRFIPIGFALIDRARAAVGSGNGAEAVRLLQPAAEDGDGEAALFLGNILLYGSGRTAGDPQGARRWLEMAASQGRIDAIYNLGAIYDKGIGVPRDAAEAIKWFTLAADQRDPTSQLNLALFYLKGDGVEKSLAAAELWLQRSANNGSKRAQGILARGAYKER